MSRFFYKSTISILFHLWKSVTFVADQPTVTGADQPSVAPHTGNQGGWEMQGFQFHFFRGRNVDLFP